MATQKRRVIYLSDEEWAKIGERSEAFRLSRSQYLGKLIEWRQPGPIFVATGERGKDPLPPERPFTEFRPVPKPGGK